MSLQPLPEALTPDAVEKMRWETFGHRRAASLQSADDQVRFITQRGFVLLFPASGMRYPSLLEATVGRPLLDFTWDERTRSMTTWHVQTLRARKVGQSAVLGGQPTAVSPHFLAQFFRVSELAGEVQDCRTLQESGHISGDVVRVVETVIEQGPLPFDALGRACDMHQPAAVKRFERAVADARRHLLLVEVDAAGLESDQPQPIIDHLPRVFPAVVEKAHGMSVAAAREHIVVRFLRNVLQEAAHEMARVLGWPEAAVLETCEALIRKGHVHKHPASRPNRHLFQATSTDLLPEAPAAS